MPRRYITQRDIVRFTEGSCHQLAKAIHDETGWPMCAFWDTDDDVPDVHAFVETPDGRYLDILGLHTASQMYDKWTHHMPIRRGLYLKDFADFDHATLYHMGADDHHRRARQLVPEVLARFWKEES